MKTVCYYYDSPENNNFYVIIGGGGGVGVWGGLGTILIIYNRGVLGLIAK